MVLHGVNEFLGDYYRRWPHRTNKYVCLAKIVTALITNTTSHKINVFKIQIYL